MTEYCQNDSIFHSVVYWRVYGTSLPCLNFLWLCNHQTISLTLSHSHIHTHVHIHTHTHTPTPHSPHTSHIDTHVQTPPKISPVTAADENAEHATILYFSSGTPLTRVGCRADWIVNRESERRKQRLQTHLHPTTPHLDTHLHPSTPHLDTHLHPSTPHPDTHLHTSTSQLSILTTTKGKQAPRV